MSNDEYQKWKKNAIVQKAKKPESRENQELEEGDDVNPPKQNDNLDQSVYDDDPDATQQDDIDEDLALLDDDDMGW